MICRLEVVITNNSPPPPFPSVVDVLLATLAPTATPTPAPPS